MLVGSSKSPANFLTKVVEAMGGSSGGKMEYRENWLNYPDSRFDNLRNGCPGEPLSRNKHGMT